MKTNYRSCLLAFCTLLFACPAFAQKEKVSEEKIQQICTGLPLEKRPRITVARFNVTSPTQPDGQFGDNLATMLSNALQNSQCYRVLVSLRDSSDMLDEMKFGGGNHADKKTSLKNSKMQIANVIATGEITKYEVSSKSVGITALKTTKNAAAIGVVIRLINPETRDIISMHEFNVEKKTDGGMRIGVGLPLIGDLNLTSTAMKNPAVQSAAEEAMKQAVAFISGEREKIPLPAETPENANNSSITINNISYAQLSTLSAAIEKIPGVSAVNSDDFANNTATLAIDHTLKLKELIDKIMQAKTGVELSVTGVNKEGATMSVK